MQPPKEYLGDSVYATFDGLHVVLTTENGMGPTNQIYLEPSVVEHLCEFFTRIRKKPNPESQEP